jgi:hypothetical protein
MQLSRLRIFKKHPLPNPLPSREREQIEVLKEKEDKLETVEFK